MHGRLKRSLVFCFSLFTMFLFDPLAVLRKWRAIPYFVRNALTYRRLNRGPTFPLEPSKIYFTTYDRFDTAGAARGHYFYQDIWAAGHLFKSGNDLHVDVGSRVDGFVAHAMPFCNIIYVDLRPLECSLEHLEFRKGSILEMPFDDNSVKSLSCLHVIEHIGLGRYGDQVNPDGYCHAARELTRILAPGGTLLLGTPVGREQLYFDAHRIFDPETVREAFSGLDLLEFSLIDDRGAGIIRDAELDTGRQCQYGCGLFRFVKPLS